MFSSWIFSLGNTEAKNHNFPEDKRAQKRTREEKTLNLFLDGLNDAMMFFLPLQDIPRWEVSFVSFRLVQEGVQMVREDEQNAWLIAAEHGVNDDYGDHYA